MTGCDTSVEEYYLNDVIRIKHFEELSKTTSRTLNLTVNSIGGEVTASTLIAEFFARKTLNITVVEKCWSACSSILLAAADNIYFHNQPLIGFHWSSIMDIEQYKRAGGDFLGCDDDVFDNYRREKKIYEKRNHNISFWKEVENKLVLKRYEIIDRGKSACNGKEREFENNMWFPTSEQLREKLGLDFKGTVCADNYEECSQRIDLVAPIGISVVIGDKVYISRGN